MLPEWLIVIVVFLIAAILLDGYRRMRLARRERITLSKNADIADTEEFTVGNGEFPTGGARVAGYRDSQHASSVNKNLKQTYLSKKTTVGAPNRIPEQVTLNLDEHVPMLMDSVESPKKAMPPADMNDVETSPDHGSRHHEPTLGDLDTQDDNNAYEGTGETIGESDSKSAKKKTKRSSKNTEAKSEEPVDDDQNQPDEVLIINVMAKTGTRFHGEDLLSVLVSQKMKLGAMDIFHRHMNDDGEGLVLFSLANMVVPGTFNLARMNEFETPGVSLFLSLPLPCDSNDEQNDGLCIKAFNAMADTAIALANELDGELKDENRSVMTQQTIEHARQRVVEYERKQRLARV